MKSMQEIYGIEEQLIDALDLKLGYIKSKETIRDFKDKYDFKHRDLEYTRDNLIKYESRRIYTMGRFMQRFYKV